MKVGDRLYCKKDWRYENWYCEKGKFYTVGIVNRNTCTIILDGIKSRGKIGFYRNSITPETYDYKYVYNYFNTPKERADRIRMIASKILSK